ncbi:hypothetical protein STAS_18819 [Striga asiatica]|uniref:Uncharacterized protein n=1 Tax=Striga asiatica TaxID=4170 RepID=A0A5A7Q9W9_STRAF|nr:hypothetical protein STAS_18819 [Striga asiatica]
MLNKKSKHMIHKSIHKRRNKKDRNKIVCAKERIQPSVIPPGLQHTVIIETTNNLKPKRKQENEWKFETILNVAAAEQHEQLLQEMMRDETSTAVQLKNYCSVCLCLFALSPFRRLIEISSMGLMGVVGMHRGIYGGGGGGINVDGGGGGEGDGGEGDGGGGGECGCGGGGDDEGEGGGGGEFTYGGGGGGGGDGGGGGGDSNGGGLEGKGGGGGRGLNVGEEPELGGGGGRTGGIGGLITGGLLIGLGVKDPPPPH